MKIIRFTLSLLTLIFLMLFFYKNIKAVGSGGQGYIFLVFVIINSIVLFFLGRQWLIFKNLKKSILLLVVFLSYFMISYLFDSMDLSAFKQVTVGTTGGILFGLMLGSIISLVIESIYRISIVSKLCRSTLFIFSIIFLVTNLYLLNDSFNEYLQEVRADMFLIDGQENDYQRAGQFMLMQFMILSSIVVINYLLSVRGYLSNTILSLLLIANAIQISLISQLIGSNSGLATVLGFLIVFIIFILIISTTYNYENKRIGLKQILFGWLGRKIIVFSSLSLMVSGVGIIYLVDLSNFDINSMRIFNYGEGGVSSFGSRLYLLKSNFIEHFSYNPIFGNTQVDSLTTGTGTYVHSLLLSVLTHLGIIGLALFIAFNFFIYKEIINVRNGVEVNSIYSQNQYALFRFLAVGVMLVFGTLTTFYTWMPYWFSIGLYGLAFKNYE